MTCYVLGDDSAHTLVIAQVRLVILQTLLDDTYPDLGWQWYYQLMGNEKDKCTLDKLEVQAKAWYPLAA